MSLNLDVDARSLDFGAAPQDAEAAVATQARRQQWFGAMAASGAVLICSLLTVAMYLT